MTAINLGDVAEMLTRRTARARPNKFSTMLQKVGFFEGFEKAAGVVDLGKRMRNLQAYAESKAKSVVKNWTPDSPTPFHKVMEKEAPRIPNWKTKMQSARA